jgi:hypothetical protein
MSFPLLVSMEKIVRAPDFPKYSGDSRTLIAVEQELNAHQATSSPF